MQMTFFGSSGDHPSREQMMAVRRRTAVPENEIPVAMPCGVLLVRTDNVAVAMVGVRAYTTGLAFDLVIRLRRPPARAFHGGLHELIGGFHRSGVPSDQQLLFGVEFADGRKVANIGLPDWSRAEVDEHQPMLFASSGGGSDLSYDQSYLLTPVPPDGPLTLVCTWPVMGITETRHIVGSTELAPFSSFRDAAAQAVVLWPWELEPEPETTEPALPKSGWFGEAARGSQGV